MNTVGYTRQHPQGLGIYYPKPTTTRNLQDKLLPAHLASKLYHRQTWRVKGYASAIKKEKLWPASEPSAFAHFGRGKKKKIKRKNFSYVKG